MVAILENPPSIKKNIWNGMTVIVEPRNYFKCNSKIWSDILKPVFPTCEVRQPRVLSSSQDGNYIACCELHEKQDQTYQDVDMYVERRQVIVESGCRR